MLTKNIEMQSIWCYGVKTVFWLKKKKKKKKKKKRDIQWQLVSWHEELIWLDHLGLETSENPGNYFLPRLRMNDGVLLLSKQFQPLLCNQSTSIGKHNKARQGYEQEHIPTYYTDDTTHTLTHIQYTPTCTYTTYTHTHTQTQKHTFTNTFRKWQNQIRSWWYKADETDQWLRLLDNIS